MYRDKETARVKAAERQRKHRQGVTEGVTSGGVTGGVTWYPNKPTDAKGRPITPVILSDGQTWYPTGKPKGLSEEILNNIAQAGKIFNDTDARMERALRYKKWVDDGKPRSKSVSLSNGAYIAVDKLVDKKWRGLLTYLVENLKPEHQDSIRVGMSGPSVRECKKLLEVTA